MVHSNLIDFSREFLDNIAACKFAGGTFLDLILLLLLLLALLILLVLLIELDEDDDDDDDVVVRTILFIGSTILVVITFRIGVAYTSPRVVGVL